MQCAVELLRNLTETQSYSDACRKSAHVQETWGPILRNFEIITPQQYRAFLDFDVNQHWTSLYRQATRTLENDGFRLVLAALATENVDVADRIDEALNVPGMGIGTASALLCTMDGRWGVLNGTTKAALKKLGLWPTFPRGLTKGGRYLVVNDILFDLAGRLGVTQWEIDHLMWLVLEHDSSTAPEPLRENELSKAYEKIAAGVKHRTKQETDCQIRTHQTVNAVALKEGCDIETLIKRLAEEQGHRCKITKIPFEPIGWNAPSPDRIHSTDREYADGKVQLVCKWINFAKGNKPDEEFHNLMHQAVECMTESVESNDQR